jgi:hypothetical protein
MSGQATLPEAMFESIRLTGDLLTPNSRNSSGFTTGAQHRERGYQA